MLNVAPSNETAWCPRCQDDARLDRRGRCFDCGLELAQLTTRRVRKQTLRGPWFVMLAILLAAIPIAAIAATILLAR